MLASGDYTDSLGPGATITPEQSEAHPIVRLSGFDRWSDGSFVIGDVSEGRVTLFEASGKLRTVLGTKGPGPGEFAEPRHPRFADDGRIYVADDGQRALKVYDATGTRLRTTAIAPIGFITGFATLPGGRLLFAGASAEHDSVLVLTDSLGNPIRRFLPIARTLPAGAAAHPAWESLRTFALAVRKDTAFVVTTISDSLWMVDLRTGATAALHLQVPGYERPALPETFKPGPRGLAEWTRTFHGTVTIKASDDAIYIPFVKGVLNYGDPTILVTHDRTHGWLAFNTRRPLVHVGTRSVTVIADPGADRVSLVEYPTRGRP